MGNFMPRATSGSTSGRDYKLIRQLAYFIVIDVLVVYTILLALHNITSNEMGHAQAAVSAYTAPTTTVAAPISALLLGPQVLNISLSISNDEIVGRFGYWALANYTRTVKGYRILNSNSSNSYFLIVGLNGTWRTFAGSLSPDNGTAEPLNGQGRT